MPYTGLQVLIFKFDTNIYRYMSACILGHTLMRLTIVQPYVLFIIQYTNIYCMHGLIGRCMHILYSVVILDSHILMSKRMIESVAYIALP